MSAYKKRTLILIFFVDSYKAIKKTRVESHQKSQLLCPSKIIKFKAILLRLADPGFPFRDFGQIPVKTDLLPLNLHGSSFLRNN